jgi:hypothetical protein
MPIDAHRIRPRRSVPILRCLARAGGPCVALPALPTGQGRAVRSLVTTCLQFRAAHCSSVSCRACRDVPERAGRPCRACRDLSCVAYAAKGLDDLPSFSATPRRPSIHDRWALDVRPDLALGKQADRHLTNAKPLSDLRLCWRVGLPVDSKDLSGHIVCQPVGGVSFSPLILHTAAIDLLAYVFLL